jgi:hypothetical protein
VKVKDSSAKYLTVKLTSEEPDLMSVKVKDSFAKYLTVKQTSEVLDLTSTSEFANSSSAWDILDKVSRFPTKAQIPSEEIEPLSEVKVDESSF